MLKNLSKNLSIYLLIMGLAAVGFALIALSNSTAALATSHDEPEEVITTDNCWKYLELGESYPAPGGLTNRVCRIALEDFQPYLNYKLPLIDETYDTRENYIQRLYDDMIAGCRGRLGDDSYRCRVNTESVGTGFLYSHLSTTRYLAYGQESELLVLTWAENKVNDWGHESLYAQARNSRASYYVYRPIVQPRPPQDDREPPVQSPATPPSLPSESNFGGHEDNQAGWDNDLDDQYRYNEDGYFRRKKQTDGTFKCYFNGHDGSLANLGEC